MTTSTPPSVYFNGITFNPTYFEDATQTITKKEADSRYLIKTTTDTATALETFSQGIKTNSIENVNTTDITNISTTSSGSINIGTSASRTTANPIIIGNATNSIIRLGSPGLSFSTSGSTPTATLQSILTSGIFVQTPTAAFNFLNNQTGILTIGIANNRTGDISIANTQTTGTGNIVLGSLALTTGTQNIQINRPLTIGYTVSPSSINQIGGTAFINGGEQPYSSISATGGSLNLAVLSNIPIGIYQVFYNISTTITVASAIITERTITVSSASGDTTLANTLNFMRDSELLHETRVVGHNITVSGCGILVNTTSSAAIYLNQRFIYSAGPTVKATGHLRIVRIG